MTEDQRFDRHQANLKAQVQEAELVGAYYKALLEQGLPETTALQLIVARYSHVVVVNEPTNINTEAVKDKVIASIRRSLAQGD